MMHQDSKLVSGENIPASQPVIHSLHLQTNPIVPQAFSVPPPNIYIPPFVNYTQNCTAAYSSGQQMNFLVPPYPPPGIQNHSFPASNYLPFFPPGSNVVASKPSHYEMQFSSIATEVPFDSNLSLENSCSVEFSKNGILKDSAWIENWISVKNEKPKALTKRLAKISDAKASFKKCIRLLQELEQLKLKMHGNYKDMDVKSWNFLCQNFLDVKNEVTESMSLLPNVTELQKSLKKRSKKRQGQHRRNQKRKELKNIDRENRQVLHHKIDSWLKFMQGTIDNSKREESLKKEADSVLSEVLRKKAEGRRQLALVESLLKLRQLRAKSATIRGQHVPAEVGARFEKVAENLKALWEKQLLEYNVEEQGMRVMLSEAVDERDQSQVTRERQILTQWDKLLFGTRMCDFPEFYLAAERSIEAFTNIRHSWDKFTVSNEVSIQSNIPIGWILPSNPSSSNWESLLSSEKSETG